MQKNISSLIAVAQRESAWLILQCRIKRDLVAGKDFFTACQSLEVDVAFICFIGGTTDDADPCMSCPDQIIDGFLRSSRIIRCEG